MIQEGSKAPDFKLPSDTGEAVSLKDFKGRTVVLYFYPKDATSGCTKEAIDFRDALTRFKRKDAVVLGVSRDSIQSHRKFKEKQSLNFPLLSDEEGAVCAKYGVWVEKSMYGRKYMGIERTTVVIDGDGRIAKIFPKVKVTGHVAEVLAAL